MPLQQLLHNGLRSADYYIFGRESMLAQKWTRLHGQRAGLRPAWLRGLLPVCWPTATVNERCWHGPGSGTTDRQRADKAKTLCPRCSGGGIK